MPHQPLIIDHHFYHAKGAGANSLRSGAHHAKYITDEKKAELLVDARTTLLSAAIHAQYADEREGSMGSFGTVGTEQAKREIAAHTQAPVFRLIISVGEEDALSMDNGLTTKAGWEKAITTAMPAAIRAMHLDPAKVEWTAAAHRRQHGGENNPHVHLLIWERGEPSRRTGTFNEKERHAIQKSVATVLYRPELDRIGQQKTQARDSAKALTRAVFDGMELEQGFVNALTDRLATLGSHLPPKGRLAYAYLPPTTKTEVMSLAHWLSDTQPDLKTAKESFLDAAKEFASVYWSPPGSTEWGGPEQATKRQAALDAAVAKADQDFHQRLTGDLLRAASAAHREAERLAGREQWRADHERIAALWRDPSASELDREAVIGYVLQHDPSFRGRWLAAAEVTRNPRQAQMGSARREATLPPTAAEGVGLRAPISYAPPLWLPTPSAEPECSSPAIPGRVSRAGPACLGGTPPPLRVASTRPQPIAAGSSNAGQPMAYPALPLPPPKPVWVATPAAAEAQRARLRAQIGKHLERIQRQRAYDTERARRQAERAAVARAGSLVRAAWRGLSIGDREARQAATLMARDQWQRAAAEAELAAAQGIEIAR